MILMYPDENTLTYLPNIGKVLADNLKICGIETVDDLINMGSENAFLRLATVDNDACINKLYALEGAIQGIRWHNINKSRKEELKAFFNHLNL
jgi:DNA transformation protein and related proteins